MNILPPTIDQIRGGLNSASMYLTGKRYPLESFLKMPDVDGFTGQAGKFGKDLTGDSFIDVGISNIKRYLSNSAGTISTTGSGAGASTAKEFDYYMADLANRYGMDRNTAYNEALANTAYQRAVADMQASGLNPSVIYGAGRASVAQSPYVSGGYASASGNSSKGSIPGWLYYGATALAQAVGTAATKSFYGGFAIGQTAQNIMRALNNK